MFLGRRCVQDINQTLISFIPKQNQLKFIDQFRRISLCNMNYKCITKVIVNRLKSLMPLLISPYQASFVSGSSIQDNIVITNKMMHSMKKKRGRKCFMVIKIDLEKVYDRLK